MEATSLGYNFRGQVSKSFPCDRTSFPPNLSLGRRKVETSLEEVREVNKTLDFQLTNLNKGKGSQGLTALQAPSTHTFVKDSPPRQGSYKEMSGESKGVIG